MVRRVDSVCYSRERRVENAAVTEEVEVVRGGVVYGYRRDELADGRMRELLLLGDELLASWDDSMPPALQRTGCPSDFRMLEEIGARMR